LLGNIESKADAMSGAKFTSEFKRELIGPARPASVCFSYWPLDHDVSCRVRTAFTATKNAQPIELRVISLGNFK